MTLQLTLTAELEKRLRQEAERQGLSTDAVTVRLLDEHLPRADGGAALSAMFQQWQQEDQSAPDEGADDFFAALDAACTSNRKLFPPELKGISW